MADLGPTPSSSAPREITQTFLAWRGGDPRAFEALVPRLYDEMRALAAHYMRRERVDHTLRPTALAHEAYLRLADQQVLTTEDRAHFMALVAQTMRRVLADHARRHRAAKRGGGRQRVELTDDLADPASPIAADDLDSALEDLARLEPRQAKVIELRFYAGLTTEEAATVIGVSPATIKRDWVLARAWLHRELRGDA